MPSLSSLLSRPAGVLAGLTLLAILLGCMSLAIGERTVKVENSKDDTLAQEGKVLLRPGEKRTVYYPIPYASPPNLEVEGEGLTACWQNVELLNQKDDHFVVRNTDTSFSRAATWNARGLRRPAPLPAPPTPPEFPAEAQ